MKSHAHLGGFVGLAIVFAVAGLTLTPWWFLLCLFFTYLAAWELFS